MAEGHQIFSFGINSMSEGDSGLDFYWRPSVAQDKIFSAGVITLLRLATVLIKKM